MDCIILKAIFKDPTLLTGEGLLNVLLKQWPCVENILMEVFYVVTRRHFDLVYVFVVQR